MENSNHKMLKSNKLQKGKILTLFVVLSFITVVGLTTTTILSGQNVDAQNSNASQSQNTSQNLKYDPNNCFGSNVTKNTCPTHSNSRNENDTVDCFKKIEETVSGTAETENYGKTVQNFNSLIPTNTVLTSINEFVAGVNSPVKDMNGVWDLMKNQNMTRHDRQVALDEVNTLLTEAKPGFTKLQDDQLSLCITTELNSLGPTLNY